MKPGKSPEYFEKKPSAIAAYGKGWKIREDKWDIKLDICGLLGAVINNIITAGTKVQLKKDKPKAGGLFYFRTD